MLVPTAEYNLLHLGRLLLPWSTFSSSVLFGLACFVGFECLSNAMLTSYHLSKLIPIGGKFMKLSTSGIFPTSSQALMLKNCQGFEPGSAAYGRGNSRISPPLKLVWAWLKVNTQIFFLCSRTFKLSKGADTVFHLLQLTISTVQPNFKLPLGRA